MPFEPRISGVPPVWAYCVISLDSDTTMDLFCDRLDEIARQEIAEQTGGFKRYVGICERIVESFPMPDREFHRIFWRPLQKGLTRSTPEILCEPHMCVPVLPNTVHPHNRKPLRTTKPLPWSNLYHPTEPRFVVRVHYTDVDYRASPDMNQFDGIYLQEKVQLDYDRALELTQAKNAGTTPPPLVPVYDTEKDLAEWEELERTQTAVEQAELEAIEAAFSSPSPALNDETAQHDEVDQHGGANVDEGTADGQAPATSGQGVEQVLPVFGEMLASNYADPADDATFIPVVRIDTDMATITDDNFPDFHDLFAEFEILQGIVDRAKARIKEASDAFEKENKVRSNDGQFAGDEPAPASPPKQGLLQRLPRPKIPLPKLPVPVVKAMEKVKNLYKGSFLDRGISKSKLWVRETAGRVVRRGKEKDIAS